MSVSALEQAINGAQTGDAGISPGEQGHAAHTNTAHPWASADAAPTLGIPRHLVGGVYGQDHALKLMNSFYVIGRTKTETAIFRRSEDGSLTFISNDQFKLEVANIFVKGATGSGKPAPVDKFWREHPHRCELKLVFKPGANTEDGEFNLWRGFGIMPCRTRRKIRSLLRHIWKVICRRNKGKFKYLVRWLAWAVQNPDKPAGVVVVLMSRKQGTGKSSLGIVMLRIFGQHGALIDDADRLLGRFNDWLETISFVLAEEILFAGDHRTADKFKSLVTSETIQIERKFGGCRQVANRLHCIRTTNHDFAVAAGVGDRRNFVLDVDDAHACDKNWFDRLYQDLDDGGTGEFLDFLLRLQLGQWHPREILKTTETAEQQRMSGDSVSQWSQACINADAIVGGLVSLDLGQRLSTKDLRDAYASYCKQHGLRPLNEELFGKACTQMFGARVRLSLTHTQRRPWGYDVPASDQWQEQLDARLGIK